MRVEWHGQSAFTLSGEEGTVLIDPFGDMGNLAERGIEWAYPAIEPREVDLALVTHEHRDHNAVELALGEPATVRSLAGPHGTPLGEVLGVASEHDDAAGTERGANVIFAWTLDGLRIAHFGDFGQRELRPEQRAALAGLDLVFVPAGGGPTLGGAAAAEIARSLGAAWAVPMHYRTPRISFLETEDEFAAAFSRVTRLETPSFDTDELERDPNGTVAVIPAAP